ncbi:MAG: glycosyltransferase family 4 protein [Muribaculaceae bacterium]|nr:glycosyltransferase family 4 protein [Muribaculaceae bacterium]
MKIAYILCNAMRGGGVERIIIDKANALAEIPDMDVYLVSAQSDAHDMPVFPISDKVHTIRMGLGFEPGVSPFRRPITFAIRWNRWRISMRKAIKKFLHENNPDIMLSTSYDANVLPLPKSECCLILESHSSRHDTEATALIPRFRHMQTSRMARKADVVAVLNEGEARMWPEAKRCEIISNFTNITPIAPYNPDIKRAMAMGRLDSQKGFDLLVEAWREVAQSHPDWKLDIYGKGAEKDMLQGMIDRYNLSDKVTLCGTTDNPAREFANHSVFVLSSRYEGQPLVLLEAASCGMACVAFDCPYGPSDIIENNYNGLLVPYASLNDAQRVNMLAKSICHIIEHRDMRLRVSQNTTDKISSFCRDAIIGKWINLFREIAKK